MSVKVLILEANPVARGFLCRVVQESFSDQLQVIEAADLESARREISAHGQTHHDGFKLMLIDLELPDAAGIDLLRDLHGAHALKVVTTLYADDDNLFPALRCGADGYLLKEDRFEVLVEELQRIVRGQPPLSPAIARKLLAHFRPGSSGESGPMALHSGFGGFSPARPFEAATDEVVRLAPRENEVLTYLSKGFSAKEIANLMGVKWYAVNDHIKSIYKKLNAASCPDASTSAAK